MNLRSLLIQLIIFSILLIIFTGFKKGNSNYSKNYNHAFAPLSDSPNQRPCFLVISDIHLNDKKLQVSSGGDSGYDLWDSAKKKINAILNQKGISKPKFLVVLGDLPFHVNDNFDNIKEVRNSFQTAYKDVRKIARNARVPLVVVPGNNDSYDGDYHQLNALHAVPLFDPASNASFADHSFTRIGFYSVYPLGKQMKLRLVVLNSVIFSSPKINPVYSYGVNKQAHATLQMRWFKKQLQQASANKEMVLIAMHIPPGNDGYPADVSLAKKYLWDSSINFEGKKVQNAFLDIIYTFRNNIIGLLASHTHLDGIRLLTKNDSTISALLIAVPSVAPGHYNNPAIKLVNYNPRKKFELENFTTWYMKYWAHTTAQDVKNFTEQYTFKIEFQCSNDTSILANTIDIMRRNKKELDNYVDSIYTVKNGSPGSLKNNASATIYVTRQ